MRRWDVAIVGSGYGGSVAAARLAGVREVVVVERGRRYGPDDFPSDLVALARAYGDLWGMRVGRGVGNAVVHAVGGASVLNYGITLEPDPSVLDGWPVSAADLAPYFRRAREVLRPSANPAAVELGDRVFLDRVAPGRRVDLENTIDWSRCRSCGNCVLGCRHDAKRSLDRTYLAIAESRGAVVRDRTAVVSFERSGEGFLLTLRSGGAVEQAWARDLILSAGTFGTADLLLAHRDRLPLSRRFGSAMSMNGDAFAFLYNTPFDLTSTSGAPISAAVRLRADAAPGRAGRALTVMSGRLPEAVMRFSAWVLGGLAEVLGENRGPLDGALARARRRLGDFFRVAEGGALSHTLMYKLDGQDAARGRLGTDRRGRAVMDWPDYRSDPIWAFADRTLEAWAERIGGRLVRDPCAALGLPSFGVHPLGGCPMGHRAADGVTDPFGRVFHPDGGVYRGLRILDASILPGALGVPPSLTIAALAERAVEQMLAEPGA